MSRATTEDRDGRPIRIPIGRATLEGDLEIPEGRGASCYSPTAAGAVGTAHETATWPGCSTRRAWPPLLEGPVSERYEFARHTSPDSSCHPTAGDRSIRLSQGETFPPFRSCNSGAVWRLAEVI